jgi:hypothetical protein
MSPKSFRSSSPGCRRILTGEFGLNRDHVEAKGDRMNIPGFDAEASLYTSGQAYRGYHVTPSAGVLRYGPSVVPSSFSGSCDVWQTLGCSFALVACSVDCALDPNKFDCLACFAGLGASSCWNCLPNLGGGGGPPPPPQCCPNPNRPYCCPPSSCVPLPHGGYTCTGTCVESARVCLGAP